MSIAMKMAGPYAHDMAQRAWKGREERETERQIKEWQ